MKCPKVKSRKTVFRPEKRIRGMEWVKTPSLDRFEGLSYEEGNFFVSPESRFGVTKHFFKIVEAIKPWNGLTCDGVSCSSMEYSSKC